MNRHLKWHWNKSNMRTQRGNILDATIKGVLVSMQIQFVDSLQYSLCFLLGEVKKMPVPVKGKWHFWAPTAYFAASVLKSVPPAEIFISWGHLKLSSSICLSTPRRYNSYFWIAFIWVKSNELPFWRKLRWDKRKIIFLKKQSKYFLLRFCFFNWSHSHILDECKSVEFSQSAVCPPWQCLNCPWGLTDSGSRQPWDGFALCCNWISQKCSWPSFPFLEKWQPPLCQEYRTPLNATSEPSSGPWPPFDELICKFQTKYLHWVWWLTHWMVQVPHGIWASCTVCLPVTTEAGHLMSKTLPPKINLQEGRERRREKGREGGEREEERKEPGFHWAGT